VFPVAHRASSVRIKTAQWSARAGGFGHRTAVQRLCVQVRSRRVNDLFLIRTEDGRRTTGITEGYSMLLAESLTEHVIGLAIEVHRHTGPGLLESVYEQCLCVELRQAGIAFARQIPIPVVYKGAQVGDGFKADIVVQQQVILEIKSVASILAVHEMQLRTYLRMSGIRVGLLLNFNAPRLMDGLRRSVV
jgi:GxxExxY protein